MHKINDCEIRMHTVKYFTVLKRKKKQIISSVKAAVNNEIQHT